MDTDINPHVHLIGFPSCEVEASLDRDGFHKMDLTLLDNNGNREFEFKAIIVARRR